MTPPLRYLPKYPAIPPGSYMKVRSVTTDSYEPIVNGERRSSVTTVSSRIPVNTGDYNGLVNITECISSLEESIYCFIYPEGPGAPEFSPLRGNYNEQLVNDDVDELQLDDDVKAALTEEEEEARWASRSATPTSGGSASSFSTPSTPASIFRDATTAAPGCDNRMLGRILDMAAARTTTLMAQGAGSSASCRQATAGPSCSVPHSNIPLSPQYAICRGIPRHAPHTLPATQPTPRRGTAGAPPHNVIVIDDSSDDPASSSSHKNSKHCAI